MKFLSTGLVILLMVTLVTIGFGKDVPGDVKVLSSKSNVTGLEAANPSGEISTGKQIFTRFQGDSVVYLEDYESGAPGWFTIDETDPGAFWHQDDWMAYGGSGLSWWMADTTLGTNGGYLSHWYQVLDSPEITVSGNATLTFVHRLKVEDPAGATAPYNGWDGVNVRISTDSGTTWTVLQNPTPAYTVTSLYSFGFEWGEGPDVPGWAGAITTWTPVSVSLAGYSGQVKIRFAFASDPAYDTNDDPTMFAWQVDEIKVEEGGNTLYYNDGSQNDMTAANWGTVGGDYWHIATDPAAPSPTHFADATDSTTGSYHPNMQDSYISPYFWLPDTITEAYMDFAVQGSFDDTGTFPEVDYFGAYVQVKGETVWRYISNITMDPNGNNYVYSSAPLSWALFSQSYSVGLVDLSPLLGDSIRMKFTFFSDEDTPIGTAMQVDDAIVWTPVFHAPAPTGLTGTAGDGVVDLMWDEMNAAGHQKFIYDSGTFGNAIHLNSGTGDAATYFNSPSPSTIDTLWLWGYSANTTSTTTLKVWEVSNGIINTNPSYTKTVNVAVDQWNVYDLTGDNWTVSGDFVAGIEISLDMWIPLDLVTVPSQHSYVNLGGWQTWQAVAIANGLPDGEWGVRAAVTYSGGTTFTYNVYRRLQANPSYGSPIATGLTSAMYHDDTVTNGETYCYVVTAVDPALGESEHSNEVCLSPQSSSIHELGYDDGVPESYFSPQVGNYIAVKFDIHNWPQDVVRVKAYFNTGSGSAQFKVWDDTGTGGLPGSELTTVNLANIQAGWNEVDVTGVTIQSGDFYAGLRYAPTTPELGIDETPPLDNMSYAKIGTAAWENFQNLGGTGDMMIRVDVDTAAVGIEEINPELITEFKLLQNYPNPFNPSTKISFMVPSYVNNERVSLTVYDILGRDVATLVDGKMTPGVHQVEWNGINTAGQKVTSGIYFYKLVADNKVIDTKKMILMK
jgi:hypothetical protein